ncbi:MAG: class I SAM-dependent DNA methyltransferase [Verrucomicrobia bacterium]|nr:class I SAM-dependent DNA methyltransferase [Verrucomicrobiota bacterium]
MTAAEFKRKWARYRGKETSAYQEHFNDLCRLLGQPTPAEADPSGSELFCFQKHVVKDAELLADTEAGPDEGDPQERGYADVWKKDCFGWEYKGKKKNLDRAYKQLLRYRESLLNPPLLIVCDFDRYIIKTNFNGTVCETHEFTNDQIDRPENLRILRAAFENPDFLKPQRTTAQVTENLAAQIGEVARSLQKRESVELADTHTRAEFRVGQKKNLRIARFLNRIVFCFFAEDTGLLPRKLFSELLKTGIDDLHHFAVTLEKLFQVMAKGGTFGIHKIRHFNGHLFEDASVFELTEDELRKLADASEADWQFIQPSIMGTLFQRALDESQRAALGAQYTCEADIRDLVEPVLMAPLRREWAALKAELVAADVRRLKTPRGEKNEPPHVVSYKAKLAAFLKKLRTLIVMDPACGSGNFLYVSLQMLLDLEKEVINFAAQLGFRFELEVSVQQLRAIEINPYAFELAQVSVQIGWLQWRRDNGFDNDRSPVLQDLDGFHNEDALLVPHFRSKARTLKEAQAGEHAGDDALKFYTEREWPECDVIVGNPPFLGGKLIRRELGDNYVDALFENLGKRVPPEADLCCYWFEKARQQIERGKCRRAGLLATQGIRGGANREVLKRIKDTGDIFFAESDRSWILAGANVHVSMIGFDDGSEKDRILNGHAVPAIHSNLSATTADTTTATPLRANSELAYMGDTKGGSFDITEAQALEMLQQPNPHGKPNSDVIVPWVNGLDVTRRSRSMFILDFGLTRPEHDCAKYQEPFAHVREHVRPERVKNNRALYARNWWRHVEARPGMLAALAPLPRFLTTVRVSKFRLFVWHTAPTLPDSSCFSFARSDDYFLGVLHSRFHEVWALKQGTRLETRPRYTPNTCFETFPFPFADDLQATAPSSAEAETLDLNGGMASMVERRFLKVREEPPPYHAAGSSGRESAHSSSSARNQSRLTSAATKDELRAAIAAAARELNDLRERWLNPPEWTRTEILEFPASVDGPWARYVECGDSSPLSSPDRLGGQAEPRPAACGKSSLPASSGGDQSPAESVDKSAQSKIGVARYPRLVPKDAECAARLKKRTLTNLYNERPTWLDLAHQKLDAAVAAAYGWVRAGQATTDLSDEQILEKLLALNLERAAEEAKTAKIKKPKAQRAKLAEEMI